MKSSCLALSLIIANFSQTARAENTFSYALVNPTIQIVKCTASLKSGLAVLNQAESLTVLIINPYYLSSCDDGSTHSLSIVSDNANADVVCKQAGFKSGATYDYRRNFAEKYDLKLSTEGKLELIFRGSSSDIWELSSVICTK